MYKFSFCLTPDILFFKIKNLNWKCISLDKISLHEEVKVLFEYTVLFYAQYAIQFSKASEVETNNYFSKKCNIFGIQMFWIIQELRLYEEATDM